MWVFELTRNFFNYECLVVGINLVKMKVNFWKSSGKLVVLKTYWIDIHLCKLLDYLSNCLFIINFRNFLLKILIKDSFSTKGEFMLSRYLAWTILKIINVLQNKSSENENQFLGKCLFQKCLRKVNDIISIVSFFKIIYRSTFGKRENIAILTFRILLK